MGQAEPSRLVVPATLENPVDVFDVRHGRIVEADVRRFEVAEALVLPDVLGLLVPLRLVEQLGLEPVRSRWVAKHLAGGRPTDFPRPIPHGPVRLTVQGRDCTVEVGAIADHQPVVLGLIPLGALGWKIDEERHELADDPILIGTAIEQT